jgi:hypothetical protein
MKKDLGMSKTDKLLIKYLQRRLDSCYDKFYYNKNVRRYPNIGYGMKDEFKNIYKLLSHLQKIKIKKSKENEK